MCCTLSNVGVGVGRHHQLRVLGTLGMHSAGGLLLAAQMGPGHKGGTPRRRQQQGRPRCATPLLHMVAVSAPDAAALLSAAKEEVIVQKQASELNGPVQLLRHQPSICESHSRAQADQPKAVPVKRSVQAPRLLAGIGRASCCPGFQPLYVTSWGPLQC